MKKAIVALLACLSLPAFAEVLDFRKTASFDVRLITRLTPNGGSAAFYSIDNAFTNTLVCEVKISIPVLDSNGTDKHFVTASLKNEYVFSNAAFPELSPLLYSIDSDQYLSEGEKIEGNYTKTIKASAVCKGTGPEAILPTETCRQFFPKHDEICSYDPNGTTGKRVYPFYKNEAFVGICKCD